MNAVEIEAAVSDLAAQPFNATEFPFQFLAAFDKKETTLKRLRKGDSNKSDVPDGVLLQANIHMAVCPAGETLATLERMKASPKTAAAKAKFVLATDGVVLEAEDLTSGETIAPDYPRFAEHIGFFLPLAGISTVREIKDNPIDVRATGRLNKLYVELLRQNPEWATEARRHDMNHFMARLIFCFFAENTDIFNGHRLFSNTVEQFTEGDGSNTHVVVETCFGAMNRKQDQRTLANTPGYAVSLPYVNGGLFAGSTEVPQFTRIARSYLLQAGSLDWQHINPDIFGSMIQAVADEAERGALGMHYTSVPNILKVLNPLFLDELRSLLEVAGDNGRMLLNLRRRLKRIRVFDPACGSGNFLVIAYKELRKIEAEINRRRGEQLRPTDISKRNFRGIELRDFAAEIARLALVLAEYQCDVLHRGPLAAKAEFLPLDEMNWITRGNALRLDWLKVCPPEGTGVKLVDDDLFQTPLDQPEIDFENEGGETYICGNPQFKGARKQSKEQKEDMSFVFGGHKDFKDCDYVTAWYLKAADFIAAAANSRCAFVSTSSISEGEQVAYLWARLYRAGCHILFAHRGFKWRNNAASNAVVHCVIVGFGRESDGQCTLYEGDTRSFVATISPYLIPGDELFVEARSAPISDQLTTMVSGSMARDGGNLILDRDEVRELVSSSPGATEIIRGLVGSEELVHFRDRYCIWISQERLADAIKIPRISDRIERVRVFRTSSSAKTTNAYATIAHMFAQRAHREMPSIIVGKTTSEDRKYFPTDILDQRFVVSDAAFALYAPALFELAIISSTLHLNWISTVCGRLESRYRYSSTLGWNTFPVPPLTEQNKADLTRCAEDILLAREAHFPATIADLYNPENMPANLRAAHDANDETLERIYIGRRFRNDTERLEKLFEMYAKMTAAGAGETKRRSPWGKTTKTKEATGRAEVQV